MLLETLLSVGAALLTLIMLLTIIYYSLFTTPLKVTTTAVQTQPGEPTFDDEMAYLVFSMYPYHEYVHFPAMPMGLGQQDATQPPQAYNQLAMPSFTLERQDTPQLA